MHSDATFATSRTPTAMMSCKDILAQLGNHSVKVLRNILTHVRLRESDADANAENDDKQAQREPEND